MVIVFRRRRGGGSSVAKFTAHVPGKSPTTSIRSTLVLGGVSSRSYSDKFTGSWWGFESQLLRRFYRFLMGFESQSPQLNQDLF